MHKASRMRKRTPAEREANRLQRPGAKEVRLMIRVAMGPDGSLGPGKIKLMELVEEKGSIAGACRAMGMSYRRAWILLQSLNAAFREEVIATRHGGSKGGGAGLTPFGRVLLDRYKAIQEKAAAAVAPELTALQADFVQWAPKARDDDDL